MRRLRAYAGAILTWAAVPSAILFFAALAISIGVASSYHPMAPITFQAPFLVGLMILSLIGLLVLAWRHGTEARRGRIADNLTELLALMVAFALAFGGILWLVDGPKVSSVRFMGERFDVPRHYAPQVWPGKDKSEAALVISICGPEGRPEYAGWSCDDNRYVRYGDEVFSEEFDVQQRLKDAGVLYDGDRLRNLDALRKGGEAAAWDLLRGRERMTLWLDPQNRIEALLLCDLAHGETCTAMVRLGQRSLVFPVFDPASVGNLRQMQDAAQVWLGRFNSWKTAPG